MSVRHFHGPVVRSSQRNAVTLADFLHAGLLPPLIQQRTDLPGLAKGIVYYQDVLGIVTQVRRYHVPNLEANRQGAHQHHHGHDILNHDNDLAVNRLGLESERAAHNLDGLRLLDQQGRHKAGQDSEYHDKAQYKQHIDRRNRLENGYLVLKNPGGRRRKRFGQQDGQQHRDGTDNGAFRDNFEENAPFLSSYQTPGGHFLGSETGQRRGHIDIVQHSKGQQKQAHSQKQVYEAAVAELDSI